MNIIQSINHLIFRLKPKIENNGKSKPFYPNEKDFVCINQISEFVEKALTDNEKNKDVRIQKLYLILFTLYLQEYECPVTAEKMLNEKFKKPINYYIFKIKSLLEGFFVENLVKTHEKDLELMEEVSILKEVIKKENEIDKLKYFNDKIKEKKEKIKNINEIQKEILSMELTTQEIIDAIKINMNHLFVKHYV